MVAPYVADLETTLSPDRLRAYRPLGGDDLAMVTTHFWNTSLCQSLYASLGAIEVALRNGIHNALSAHYSRPDWYDIHDLLLHWEAVAIGKAKAEIRDAKRAEIAQGINPVTSARVVAALSFGFWTSLLSSDYGNSPKGPRFWAGSPSPLLAIALPHVPVADQYRGRAHRRFDELRKLRNRVFHYEPVWNRPALLAEHAEIIDAIGWASPMLQATVVRLDRFPDEHRLGYQKSRSRIETPPLAVYQADPPPPVPRQGRRTRHPDRRVTPDQGQDGITG